MSCITIFYIFFCIYIQIFPVEFPVFLREHKNAMYRTDTYFLAKTFAEVNTRYLVISHFPSRFFLPPVY